MMQVFETLRAIGMVQSEKTQSINVNLGLIRVLLLTIYIG